ncbi:unnamed protein product [Musa acuminata subsp. malaccensis]|uniref:(wild Malaysian banana) hypothetical protein n=1 Tax=Musa acuminata subsp. malaccensis TaxID=214687 RepID=A0A804J062_MUSAM|nr:PREDICTED: F-box/kelch-repeat protein At1g57790-like [Musa acuminata subsp. malaccensis]CAG1837329.1 unnamed protein product [Musa acuminata subsp. malaccensis]
MVGRPFKGEGEKRAKCTEEEGKEEERVDWSNLDTNILQLIADQLTVDIADYIRFHGVCKTWHAVNHHGRTHPPQLPWLLMRCDYDINRLIFYSFSDERFHSIRPPTNDEHIIGSCDGWLVLDHKTSRFLSLLNPLTGARIHLPALPSYLINIEDYYPSILKIAISSNPSMYDHDCIIVIISTLNDALFSIRLWEDDLWTLLDDRSKYHDVTYFKGNLYAVDEIAQVFIFSSFFEKVAIVGPQRETNNLLWQFTELSGELIVLRNILIENSVDHAMENLTILMTERIDILKLNMKGLVPSLEEAKSIGNHILFLGVNSRSISCPISQYPRGKHDTIYIHHVYIMDDDEEQDIYCRHGIYDLENAFFMPTPHNGFERICTGMLPMWFTPSLF